MRLGNQLRTIAVQPSVDATYLLHQCGHYLTQIAAPLGIMAVALFLRVYRLEELGWVPDTYERLFDAQRLASGEFPASEIYLPGVSVVLAPFFLIFSDSLPRCTR